MYVVQPVYQFKNLNPESLAYAINKIINRYDILRSSFHLENDKAYMIIHDHVECSISEHDWTDETSEFKRRIRLKEYLDRDRRNPFKFDEPPIIRPSVIRITSTASILILTHHHILLDGISSPIVSQQLLSIYNAHKGGYPEPIINQGPPFKVFLDWLAAKDPTKDIEFWRQYLSDFQINPVLPCEVAYKSSAKHAGFNKWSVLLEESQVHELDELARNTNTTLSSVLLAALAITCQRHTGQKDFIIGLLFNGRPPELDGSQRMVGMFMNTLPFRAVISDEELISDYIQKVHLSQLQIASHQFISLNEIASICEVNTESQLIQCILDNKVSLTRASSASATSALQSREVAKDQQTSMATQSVPLHFNLEAGEGGINFTITYDLNRFNAELVAAFCERYRIILHQFSRASKSTISSLTVLTKSEEQRLQNLHQPKLVDFDQSTSVYDLFSRQVQVSPERIALMYEDTKLSYQDLYLRTRQVASHLLSLGLSGQSIVAFQVERNAGLPILVLALLLIGATYVPIDETVPRERIEVILADSGATHLISSQSSLDQLPGIFLDYGSVLSDSISVKQFHDLPDTGSNERIAYILYTSGSTGRPKGIKLAHRVIVSRILCDPFPPDLDEVFISKTSYAFVDFMWELMLPLAHGACCQIVPTEACKRPEKLIKYLANPATRRIVLVPSLLTIILELSPSDLSEIRHIQYWFSTGEPLSPDLANRFYKQLPLARLFNLYGASEVWDISLSEVPSTVTQNSLILAGHPIPNTLVFIVDDNDNPVPPGMVGNILVGGSHLSSGYQNSSQLNSDAFTTVSLFGNTYSVWRAGDQGFWHDSGELVVQGRRDTLVKLRGYRIDLNEIEIVAKSHASIRDCAVSVYNSDTLAISLLIAKDEDQQNVPAIKSYLRERLPENMIPSVWTLHRDFPYLSSGKIDRVKLAQEVSCSSQSLHEAGQSEGTLSPIQKLVLATAQRFLPSVTLKLNSNFFESGGHSLMAVRILSKLSQEVGASIPLEAIFNNPTFELLSNYIDTLDPGEDLTIKRQESYEELSPLSLSQRRLWIVDTLNPRADTYILTNIVDLNYPLLASTLANALSHLVQRHAVLSSRLVVTEGEPYQFIDASLKCVPIEIPASLSADGSFDDCSGILSFHSPEWNLYQGPLFYLYYQTSAATSRLGLRIHHIISDGQSIKIFFEELCHIYQNLQRGQDWSHNLSALTLDYRDYAIWQYDWLQSSDYGKHLAFWKQKFDGRPTRIEFLSSSASQPNHSSAHQSVSLSQTVGPEVTQRLRDLAIQHQTSLFNVLLAVYSLYISRHVAEPMISVGTPITGRNREDLQGVIGLFVDLLVYPLDVDETQSFFEFLASVKMLSQEVLKYSQVPFDLIVKEVSPDRDHLGQPLFQVMIVHEVISGSVEGSGSARQAYYGSDHANYDYLLLVREGDQGLQLTHHVRASLFSIPVLKAMMRRFATLCSRVSSSPLMPLNTVSMLPTPEFNKLVRTWNNTSLANPFATDTLSSRFISLARNNPSHLCVVDHFGQWSRLDVLRLVQHYRSLLEALPLDHSGSICIHLSKSVHQVALVFAITSLGHAFVPIDPSSPLSRKQAIVDASASTVLFITADHPDSQELVCPHRILVDTSLDLAELPELPADGIVDFSKTSSPCYICFTSGSTGTPKGVVVSHFNILSLFHAHSQYFCLSESSRVLSTLGFYFDAGIGEQVRCLLTGATLYFSDQDLLRNPIELGNALSQYRITHVAIPPSVLEILDPSLSKSLSSLVCLVTAGEALSPVAAQHWGAKRTIITGHGATETTVGDTISVNWNLSLRPPLGRPLPNMKAFIVDKYRRLVPPYVVGELVITGPQVTQGYLNDRAKTSLSFLPELDGIESPYQFYLTGDQAFLDHKGILYFAGRKDSQIKIRGHRIEPGEVESVAATYPGIKQVICSTYPASGKNFLALYFIGEGIDQSSFRQFLEERLPSYMVPSAIVELASFPTTPNGKIDYRSLPVPTVSTNDDDYEAPSSSTEDVLHRIWCNVLSLEKVSVRAKFFSIGGDSIQAIQVLSHCKEAGISLSAIDLFNHQTIKGLAYHIDTRVG